MTSYSLETWCEVLDKLGFTCQDEFSKAGSDTNLLKYEKYGGTFVITVNIYFNYKSGDISYILIKDESRFEDTVGWHRLFIPQDKFIEKNIQLFRDVQLDCILNK